MKNQFGKALYIFVYASCCEEPSYSINIWSCCEYALLVSRAILHSQFQRGNLRSAQNQGPLLQKPQHGHPALCTNALHDLQGFRLPFPLAVTHLGRALWRASTCALGTMRQGRLQLKGPTWCESSRNQHSTSRHVPCIASCTGTPQQPCAEPVGSTASWPKSSRSTVPSPTFRTVVPGAWESGTCEIPAVKQRGHGSCTEKCFGRSCVSSACSVEFSRLLFSNLLAAYHTVYKHV